MTDQTTDIDSLLAELQLASRGSYATIPSGVAADYHAALSALVAERNVLRKRVAELVRNADELATAIKQRDEARERYCAEAARHSVCRRSIIDKQTIAEMNGWKGLWKDGGGA